MRVLPAMPTQAGNGSVCTDAAVVSDLDLVVQLHAFFDNGIVERAAVYAVLAPTSTSSPMMTRRSGDLQPAPLVHRHAESICADHCAGMDDDPVADHAIRGTRGVGMQARTLADARAAPDEAVGADHGAVTDLRPLFDHCAGATDAEAARRAPALHCCLRMDPGWGVASGLTTPQRARNRRRDSCRRCAAAQSRRALLTQDHGTGASGGELFLILAIGKKRQLFRPRRFQRRHLVDARGGIADDVAAKAFGQLRQAEGLAGVPVMRASSSWALPMRGLRHFSRRLAVAYRNVLLVRERLDDLVVISIRGLM